MLDVVKPIVGALSTPLTLAMILLLVAGVARLLGRRRLGRFLAVLGLLVVFVSSWAPVSNGLLEPLEWTHTPVWDPGDHPDVSAVVVLGAGWEPDLAAPASVRLSSSSVAMEDLRVSAMTRRPKAKTDDQGRPAPNGARAKAGLNKGILGSAWGRIKTYAQYKAPKHNVLFLLVPPHHSSRECAVCGHIHPDNRPTQSRFVCQRCGQTDHADHNASRVIARRDDGGG
jgi:hypothetical protein